MPVISPKLFLIIIQLQNLDLMLHRHLYYKYLKSTMTFQNYFERKVTNTVWSWTTTFVLCLQNAKGIQSSANLWQSAKEGLSQGLGCLMLHSIFFSARMPEGERKAKFSLWFGFRVMPWDDIWSQIKWGQSFLPSFWYCLKEKKRKAAGNVVTAAAMYRKWRQNKTQGSLLWSDGQKWSKLKNSGVTELLTDLLKVIYLLKIRPSSRCYYWSL